MAHDTAPTARRDRRWLAARRVEHGLEQRPGVAGSRGALVRRQLRLRPPRPPHQLAPRRRRRWSSLHGSACPPGVTTRRCRPPARRSTRPAPWRARRAARPARQRQGAGGRRHSGTRAPPFPVRGIAGPPRDDGEPARGRARAASTRRAVHVGTIISSMRISLQALSSVAGLPPHRESAGTSPPFIRKESGFERGAVAERHAVMHEGVDAERDARADDRAVGFERAVLLRMALDDASGVERGAVADGGERRAR